MHNQATVILALLASVAFAQNDTVLDSPDDLLMDEESVSQGPLEFGEGAEGQQTSNPAYPYPYPYFYSGSGQQPGYFYYPNQGYNLYYLPQQQVTEHNQRDAVTATTPYSLLSFFDPVKRVDAVSVGVPLMIAGGVALSLPWILGCDPNTCIIPLPFTKRSKRSADDELSFELALDSYRAAIKDEGCMKRVLCETGSGLRNLNHKKQVFKVIDEVVPAVFKSQAQIFKEGAFSNPEEAGHCLKYECSAKAFNR